MLLQPGEILNNRYRIVKLLAQGGFGTLYRAWDTALGRPCALKENLDSSPAIQRQFLKEAKILANLTHPGLPRVTDYFLIQAQAQYLVMDYVEGQDLQQMLEDRGSPLPESRVLIWAGQICDALVYLHSQNPPVIHRDIKPANIKITTTDQAVLVDFGIAKVYDSKLKTTQGAQAVSPGYSPYEQYGKGKTDPRSDIYALGATLYTILTAQEPPESIQRVVRDPIQPARQLNPSLSLRTSASLMKALQMDATQRFQSAEEFKKALLPVPIPQSAVPAAVSVSQPAQPVRNTSAGLPLWGWFSLLGLMSLIVLLLLAILMRGTSTDGTRTPQSLLVTAPQSLSIQTSTLTPGVGPATPTARLIVTFNPLITPYVYIVQAGDTCSEIAEAYGVSIESIVALNQSLLPDCSVLYSGQALLVPPSDEILATPVTIRSPTVQPALVTQISSIDGMELVYIPSGEFTMGATANDPNAGEFEKPEHLVYLSVYWIDRTEVTNAMYEQCVRAGACEAPGKIGSKTRESYFSDPQYMNYPVIYVSWEDAAAYCAWADRRLPTEAEWEKAARGKDKRLYPWGNGNPNGRLANFGGLIGDTNQVGGYPAGASPYGVLDMAGNVAEWVADWFNDQYYSKSVYKNPAGPISGEFRIMRGGSWFNQASSLRTTFRLWNYPDLQSETVGFRCAR